jgi:hypothetical protein
MRFLSAAQITREIDQLKKFLSVYSRHNLSEMIYDIEKRIFELEMLLEPKEIVKHAEMCEFQEPT